MKVGIISSSPNEIGLTNSCVNICLETLKEKNIKTEWIVLNKYNIKKCEACGNRGWGICLEEHKCVMDEEFNSLQNTINKFDAIIVISPVYFYEMSESAKTFFDKLKRCQSFNENSLLKNKKMLCIACAGGSGDGTEETLNQMKILAKFLHMNVAKYIGITKKNFEEMKKDIVNATLKLYLEGNEDTMEYLDVVDENNNLTGIKEERDVIHQKGLWHREVAVWVINENGEILIQKRASLKKEAPNKWGTCAGHIDAGETVEIAVIRELQEELGVNNSIKDLEFINIHKSEDNKLGNTINNKFIYIYIMKTSMKIEEYKIQLEELSEIKYITFEELKKMVENKDTQVTFSTRDYMPKIIEEIKNRI